MFIESFHRVLNIIFLKHKQNRRIDVLLVTLLKIARDKANGHLVKQEKGKPTHRHVKLTGGTKRHSSSLQEIYVSFLSLKKT